MKLHYLVAAAFSTAITFPALANDDMTKYQDEARKVAKEFVTQLGGELKKEMEANGPGGAIKVCRDVAPAIASDLSRKNGWQVRRVSLKVRNPLLGTPDAWEQKVLADFDEKAGKDPASLEVSEIVSEPQGKYFRYMKAIPVQDVCLKCHGTDAVRAQPANDALVANYPHDKATGYSHGLVRGAVTIKRPLF